GTFTAVGLRRRVAVGTVCRAPNGISGGLSFFGRREKEEGQEKRVHHLTYRRKDDLMPNVSISPYLAELPSGGPETATSGSFPPRSPETSLHIHATLSGPERTAGGPCRGDPWSKT